MDIVFDQTCLVMLSGKYTTIFNLKRNYCNEVLQINITNDRKLGNSKYDSGLV